MAANGGSESRDSANASALPARSMATASSTDVAAVIVVFFSVRPAARIVDAAGDRLELYLDSGVRRGVDVLAALALGARAVLVGRAPMYGLAVDGADGVRGVLELLRLELVSALHLAGVASAAAVPRDVVWR